MSTFDEKNHAEVAVPAVKEFAGIGELVVGGVAGGSNINHILFTALVVQDNPQTNSYLLANKLSMADRFTKTVIFPREGMALPEGEVFEVPQEEDVLQEEVSDLSETQES